MKSITTQDDCRPVERYLPPDSFDSRTYELYAYYIHQHGRPRGPLSVLTRDRRMAIECKAQGVAQE